MLLFTIVKCCLCFLHLFPMARLRAKSGNSLPPISPGRSAGESNKHKIKLSISSFHDFSCAIQIKTEWPTTTRTHTIISALMGFTLVENGGPGVNVGNPNIFNGSGVFKVFEFKGNWEKNTILYSSQVIYGLLVSPTLTFLLSFGFYFFLYKTVVKVRSMFNQHHCHHHHHGIFFISLGSICCWIPAKNSAWQRLTIQKS